MKRFWLATTTWVRRVSAAPVSLLLLLILISSSNELFAQQTTEARAAYEKSVTERVTKIINTLAITDSVRYKKVLGIVVNQYYQLNDIHAANEVAVKEIKALGIGKDELAAALKQQEDKKGAQLLQQHQAFLNLMGAVLSEAQIEQVKDGMTYRVFPNTYAAYQDMLPNLTKEQKDKIYNWLKEARELAMDAESSDKKHAVFGKYKGKINNYLSAAGYDMKKEGEEWQKRIKAREASNKTLQGS